MWRTGRLETPQSLAILLGAPVHHDPALLPVYREAIESPTPRIRQAAAYGYHDLIGDRLPDVSAGVSGREAARLAAEMDVLAETLRRQPLVAMLGPGAALERGAPAAIVLGRRPAAVRARLA